MFSFNPNRRTHAYTRTSTDARITVYVNPAHAKLDAIPREKVPRNLEVYPLAKIKPLKSQAIPTISIKR